MPDTQPYSTLWNICRSAAARIVGPTDADDVAQDFAVALLANGIEPQNPGAYARRAGRFGAISVLRRHRRQVGLPCEPADTGRRHDDLRIERLDLIKACSELGNDDTTVLIDLALGVDAATTAAALGVSVVALYQRRRRLRVRLEARLDGARS